MTLDPTPSRLSILTTGFATAVAMWGAGYLSHLPALAVPGWIVLPVLLACLVAGGWFFGRRSGLGLGAAALMGVVAGLVNVLILGSLISGDGEGASASELVPSIAIWVPGSLLVHAACAVAGAAIGMRRPMATIDQTGWRFGMGLATVGATLLVVVAGGLVTSTETGLAVPDWPNSFGSNMVLYPLAKMTGGIYYEHAHRLYGMLVGLSTLVLAGVVWRTEHRGWVRTLAMAAFIMVCVQGVMGGLRVTGDFTTSMNVAELAPSTTFAILHGVFGQCVFAVIAVIAAVSSPAWQRGPTAIADPGGASDRTFTTVLVLVLLGQLILGAMYRHQYTTEVKLPWPAHAHLTFAAVALVVAGLAGIRAWSRDVPVVPRLGAAVLLLLGVQFILGIAALIAILARQDQPYPAEIMLATAHQANGALLLATATVLAAWTRRVFRPAERMAEGSVGMPGATS